MIFFIVGLILLAIFVGLPFFTALLIATKVRLKNEKKKEELK